MYLNSSIDKGKKREEKERKETNKKNEVMQGK